MLSNEWIRNYYRALTQDMSVSEAARYADEMTGETVVQDILDES